MAGVEYEQEAWSDGYYVVAGLDEVGRGALAGPVVAAAVVLDRERIPDGLADSKTLVRTRREALSSAIADSALGVAIACIEAPEIDATNILRATLAAMLQAVGALPVVPDYLLVDGNSRIPEWTGTQRTVVAGDAASASIAAASIVAKVARDRLMAGYSERWPDYGFADHVGYGTAAHMDAIARLGPCPIHRRTFRGVLTTSLFAGID
ncbi:MAG: ribonuclease HII [Blastocatellia bacterium]|nr:ribonuclease HII [Blastocatellia bacterium]